MVMSLLGDASTMLGGEVSVHHPTDEEALWCAKAPWPPHDELAGRSGLRMPGSGGDVSESTRQ
jgi:hypothetical protein